MNENEIYDALGLEQPTEEPEEETQEEQAEEETQEEQAEEEVQEESSGEEESESAGSEEPQEEPEEQKQPEDHPQQDDSYHAAMRRRAQESARRQVDQEIAGMGLTDSDGKPVTNFEELKAYSAQLRQNQQQELMEANGWDKEQYNTFINNIPEVRTAKEQIAQAQMQQARAQLEADLAELSKLDPSIKSLEDLAAKPDQDKLEGYVRKGLNLIDAYKLTYGDELLARQSKAARQAAINDLRGKDHLIPDSRRGTGAVEVPQDIKDQYRMFMPNATDEEIQKNYNDYIKSTKK